MVTEKTSPTDDGTAMVVFIYGILKTLLVMFFDCLCLKPGDKYQRKKQYIRDGPWWISDMSNSGVKGYVNES